MTYKERLAVIEEYAGYVDGRVGNTDVKWLISRIRTLEAALTVSCLTRLNGYPKRQYEDYRKFPKERKT